MESDDWARRSENRFSLIVSKTIANVNKMRVNLYLQKRKTWCWQYWNQSGFHKCDWTKSSKQYHTFCRYNYLGFHITYEKSPIMYIRVCLCVCMRVLPKTKSMPLTYSTPISAQLRHNTKIVNKLNEFKDVPRLGTCVSIIWAKLLHYVAPHNVTQYMQCSYHMFRWTTRREPKRNTRHFISIKIEYAVPNTRNMYSFCYLLFNNNTHCVKARRTACVCLSF